MMDNVSTGMKSLCGDILRGHKNRKTDIKQIKGQVEVHRDNARKFLADSKKFHEDMSKDLKKNLQEGREDLIKNVDALIKKFRKKEKEIRADLAEASKIWKEMKNTLRIR